MMEWLLVDSGCQPPDIIMRKDQEMLSALTPNSQPILHLYEWQGPSLTYGYFTKPLDFLNDKMLKKYGIQSAKRPTGGGIIFHLTDWAFSLLLPSSHPSFSLNTLENYAFVNNQIAEILSSIYGNALNPSLYFSEGPCADPCVGSFCMAKPTQYDIIINGKKVGGAAQRRTKSGYLHQGSVSLAMPSLSLLQDLITSESVLKAIKQNSYCILKENWKTQELESHRKNLANQTKRQFSSL